MVYKGLTDRVSEHASMCCCRGPLMDRLDCLPYSLSIFNISSVHSLNMDGQSSWSSKSPLNQDISFLQMHLCNSLFRQFKATLWTHCGASLSLCTPFKPSHLLPNISSPKRAAHIFRKMRVKIFSAFLNKLPDSYTNGKRRQRAQKRKEKEDEMMKKKIILLFSSPYSICIFSILLFLSVH